MLTEQKVDEFSDLMRQPLLWDAFQQLLLYIVQSDGQVDRLERLHIERILIEIVGLDSHIGLFDGPFKLITKNELLVNLRMLKKNLTNGLHEAVLFILCKLAAANHELDVNELKAIRFIAKIWRVPATTLSSIEAMFSIRADAPYRILRVNPSESSRVIAEAYTAQVEKLMSMNKGHAGIFKYIFDQRVKALKEGFKSIDQLRGGQCSTFLG